MCGHGDDESGGSATTPTKAQLALVGRRFIDAKDGLMWAVFATGFDHESEVVVAYIYDTGTSAEPRSLLECEYMDADELTNGDDYDWLDGQPERIEDDGAALGGPAEDDDTPNEQSLFAELELARISGAPVGIGEPDEGGDGDVPIISFGNQLPTICVPATAKAICYAERQDLEFFSEIDIVVAGIPHTLRRTRDLADDMCPVFEHGGHEQLVRLRVEDISRDSDGLAWIHGSCIYTKAQLPPSVVAALAPDFDPHFELAESIDQVQVPAAEVRGVVRVLSTSAWIAAGGPVTKACHQGAAFIEEFDDALKWKMALTKVRDTSGAAAAAAAAPDGRRRRG
jgi:hypothetical protein